MAHPLRFGVKNSGQDTTTDELRAVWRIADDAGFDHVWVFDHLAAIGPGGRLEFGIGAAWADVEHQMYGIPGLDHRVGRLSESLHILRSLWTQPRTTFEGRYYTMREAICNPKPIQQPHPPIWIGAGGERTLALTARYADVWNRAHYHSARRRFRPGRLPCGGSAGRPARPALVKFR